MNSKERMQIAMEYEEPDRVPYMVTFVPEMDAFYSAVMKYGRYSIQG